MSLLGSVYSQDLYSWLYIMICIMKRLLIQGDSNRKRRTGRIETPLSLFTGYFFRMFNSYKGDQDITVLVVSVKYGLLKETDEVEFYTEQMDAIRVKQLRPIVHEELRKFLVDNQFDEIFLCTPKLYYQCLGDVASLPQYDKMELVHPGAIGFKLNSLKQWMCKYNSSPKPQDLNSCITNDIIDEEVSK
jgi:hypothetical protein